MMNARRISDLLDKALDDTGDPRRLIDRILAEAMASGLDWRDIMSAIDLAERRTGLRLHPVGFRTERS
ncbi:MAG TPA: hypothetical protein VLL76_12040 [Candidatus Omnitrophota bacterium]|nr:hypothetical protein [Candidatus Omnitrophota bacterium]